HVERRAVRVERVDVLRESGDVMGPADHRTGFKEIWISKYNLKGLNYKPKSIQIKSAASLMDVIMNIWRQN
ncbi:MAG: hypothetical protein ACKOXH_10165, partial [Aquirufa sp.]